PRRHHGTHVGPGSLAPLDLECVHARRYKLREQGGEIETDGLFEGIVRRVAMIHAVTALADGRVAGARAAGEAVDGESSEPRAEVAACVFGIVYVAGRGTDPVHVGRQARGIVGQAAATLRHEPVVAEHETLDFAVDVL